MNYYIIPTKNVDITFSMDVSDTNPTEPFISTSFFNNITSLHSQMNTKSVVAHQGLTDQDVRLIAKINDVYPFLCEITPKFSSHVDGVIPDINAFTSIEILSLFDEMYKPAAKCPVDVFYFGYSLENIAKGVKFVATCPTTVVGCDLHTSLTSPTTYVYPPGLIPPNVMRKKILYFDIDLPGDEYTCSTKLIIDMLTILFVIVNNRTECIIKINTVLHKPIVDIVYILSGMYNNMFISKPMSVKNVNDRYIICKDPFSKPTSGVYNAELSASIRCAIEHISTTPLYVTSLTSERLSHYFINKMEESTLSIGQKCIEYYENMVVLMKLYGNDSKMEHVQNTCIDKCIHWCEKYNMSHNVKYCV